MIAFDYNYTHLPTYGNEGRGIFADLQKESKNNGNVLYSDYLSAFIIKKSELELLNEKYNLYSELEDAEVNTIDNFENFLENVIPCEEIEICNKTYYWDCFVESVTEELKFLIEKNTDWDWSNHVNELGHKDWGMYIVDLIKANISYNASFGIKESINNAIIKGYDINLG